MTIKLTWATAIFSPNPCGPHPKNDMSCEQRDREGKKKHVNKSTNAGPEMQDCATNNWFLTSQWCLFGFSIIIITEHQEPVPTLFKTNNKNGYHMHNAHACSDWE